jgi:phage shock protein A
MTLIKRLRAFFFPDSSISDPVAVKIPDVFSGLPESTILPQPPKPELTRVAPTILHTHSEPLPDWLADEESLRDEGVLFGLSDAGPDRKIAQIRAYFSQQSAPLDEQIDQYTDQIGELNQFIEQRENRVNALQHQMNDLRNSKPTPNSLIRNTVSLVCSVSLCIGNFYLIDATLGPAFANRWIPVGIFLAGMFNLFGRTSFFYETDTRLTARRLIEELGLPFATSVFVFVYALQSQGVWQAVGLWLFVFFLFLLAGKLLLSTLTALQTDVNTLSANRLLMNEKTQNLPSWEAEINRLHREIDGIRAQKRPIVIALNQTEAEQTRLNTQGDRLVNLFISEFELARSLRDRITEAQREAIMTGSPVRL